MGADVVIQSRRGQNPQELVAQIVKEMGKEVDVSLDCTGQEFTIEVAISATKMGGKLGLVGLGPEYIKVPMSRASLREVDMIGICRFRNA